jgi:PIN domain nuclease of toxin-antitoxin system
LYQPERIPPNIADIIKDRGNELLFSAASIWEIAIKGALARPDFDVDPTEAVADAIAVGFVELPVTAACAARVATLPSIHRDPFDRLLVAQAINEPANLLTSDRTLVRYSSLVQLFDPR